VFLEARGVFLDLLFASLVGCPSHSTVFRSVSSFSVRVPCAIFHSAVGKSSLVLRFVKKQFLEYNESTIGAAFLTQTVQVNDSVVKFEIWDTAGQERYHSLAPMYYRGASAAVVVYDITSRTSFQRVRYDALVLLCFIVFHVLAMDCTCAFPDDDKYSVSAIICLLMAVFILFVDSVVTSSPPFFSSSPPPPLPISSGENVGEGVEMAGTTPERNTPLWKQVGFRRVTTGRRRRSASICRGTGHIIFRNVSENESQRI
jgi:hypothetical protein